MKLDIPFIIISILLVILSDLEPSYKILGSIKYIIILIPVLYLIILKKVKLTIDPVIFPILFLACWTVIFNYTDTLQNYRYFIVLISPLFLFTSNITNVINRKNLYIIGIVIGIYFLLFNLAAIGNQSYSGFLLQSSISVESGSFFIPFALGFFSIYFLINKNKSLFILFFIMTFLSARRSVILALIISFILYNIRFVKNKKLLIGFGILLNIILIIIGVLLVNELLTIYFQEIIGIKSLGAFTSGRNIIYGHIIDLYNDLDVLQRLIGDGIGRSYLELGEIMYSGGIKAPHNEIFRLLYEVGILGLSIFLLLLYNLKNYDQFILTVFFNILLFFTNILTYPIAIIIYLSMIYISKEQYNQKLKLHLK